MQGYKQHFFCVGKKMILLQPKYKATRCVKETILSMHQNNCADATLADGLSRLNYCINI